VPVLQPGGGSGSCDGPIAQNGLPEIRAASCLPGDLTHGRTASTSAESLTSAEPPGPIVRVLPHEFRRHCSPSRRVPHGRDPEDAHGAPYPAGPHPLLAFAIA